MILPPPVAIYLQVGQPIKYQQIKPGDFFFCDGCLCVKTQWTRYVKLSPGQAEDIPTYAQHPKPADCKEVQITSPLFNQSTEDFDELKNIRKIEEIK